MDFYNFINRFELECKKHLYQTMKDKEQYDQELKYINSEI